MPHRRHVKERTSKPAGVLYNLRPSFVEASVKLIKMSKCFNVYICIIFSELLHEMQSHSDSWPFLKAVDARRVPQYRQFIKKPMDFGTMRKKIRDRM